MSKLRIGIILAVFSVMAIFIFSYIAKESDYEDPIPQINTMTTMDSEAAIQNIMTDVIQRNIEIASALPSTGQVLTESEISSLQSTLTQESAQLDEDIEDITLLNVHEDVEEEKSEALNALVSYQGIINNLAASDLNDCQDLVQEFNEATAALKAAA